MKNKLYIKLPAGSSQLEVIEQDMDSEYDFWRKQIGCRMIEIVQPVGLPEDYCLIADEEGLFRDPLVLSPIASILYGVKEHGNPIVGNALIAKNVFEPDGIDTVPLDESDIGMLVEHINGEIQKYLAD